jgi:hypothetical protein
MAEKARTLATSAASSRLLWSCEPNFPDALTSTAFFAELFDERYPRPGGDVPVDQANFVAGGVLANFVEIHAAALKHGMIFAGQRVGDEAARAQFHQTDFFQDFSGDGGVHGRNLELGKRPKNFGTETGEARC